MVFKILFIILLIVLISIYFETNFPRIIVVNIKTNKFKAKAKEKLKVLQITDYHNFKYSSRVLKLVRKAQPDIIVITGDLVDKATKDYNNAYSFLEELIRINNNIYYVPGNHELNSGNMEALVNAIEKRNIKVLMNSNNSINLNRTSINICGIDYSTTERGDLGKTLEGINTDLFTILLCHKPDIVRDYSKISCDLILCGHTHGGQIRLPFIGAVIAPGQGLLPKYNKGLYKVDSNIALYIDSGVGTTKIPIRFMNRSQISLIEIEKE